MTYIQTRSQLGGGCVCVGGVEPPTEAHVTKYFSWHLVRWSQ